MSGDSSSLAKLKAFAFREGITKDDASGMEEEFAGSSDRGCALILSAVIERRLESVIRSILREDLSNTEKIELFSHEGAMGSFSSKIQIGYALGIYGKKTKHDLTLIRHLRNAFAHTRKPLRFEMKVVRDVCEIFVLPRERPTLMKFSNYPVPLQERYEQWWDKNDPRIRFEVACHIVGSGLDGAALASASSEPIEEILP
ncbi:MAG TPA: hypothetical protein VG889_11055 [Rhizomicrobium sp.]|nr:hypothetical protein [Rhizomicrobium sp.]